MGEEKGGRGVETCRQWREATGRERVVERKGGTAKGVQGREEAPHWIRVERNKEGVRGDRRW